MCHRGVFDSMKPAEMLLDHAEEVEGVQSHRVLVTARWTHATL